MGRGMYLIHGQDLNQNKTVETKKGRMEIAQKQHLMIGGSSGAFCFMRIKNKQSCISRIIHLYCH